MSGYDELASYVTWHFDHGADRACLFIAGMPPRNESSKAPSAGSAVPTLDALSSDWEERQLQGYLFDIIAGNVAVRPGTDVPSDTILDRLTDLVGVDDYFDAYCITRGLDPVAVTTLAEQFLLSTKHEYFSILAAQVPIAGRMARTHDNVQHALSTAVGRDPGRYSYERTVSEIRSAISMLSLSGHIDLSQESAIGLTANVAHLGDRTAGLFLERAAGLESYRGALHALGHSVFSVVSMDLVDDIGVNIAATEAVAFQAQHIALGDADSAQASFLRFLHLYQARLYAIRVLHEKSRNSRREVAASEVAALGDEHLGVSGLEPLRHRSKLVAVDFLLAFVDFFHRGEIPHDWTEIRNLSSKLTNRDLVRRLQIMDPSMAGVATEIR